jgi:4-hydroxy-tetrahydrodipicolinate reductase
MNIALIGYGKMGKAIEEIALHRGHTISLKIDIANAHELTAENLSGTDAAIEFTGPYSAFENLKKLMNAGMPTICGSTGWLDNLDEIKNLCIQQPAALLYASNFSVGVNIFFELNKKLAALMAPHDDYSIQLTEIHHTQKKDAPSGTAITLAEQILELNTHKKKWVNHISDNPEELEILSERIDPAPGTHQVKYTSPIDDIEIIHTAHSRKGFASGAVLAAEFIAGKKGIFTMKDVLGL